MDYTFITLCITGIETIGGFYITICFIIDHITMHYVIPLEAFRAALVNYSMKARATTVKLNLLDGFI